jgi:hypothetical protein
MIEPDISLERLWDELNAARLRGRAAQSTVDALMFSLRSGVKALGQPNTLRRLCQLSDEQLRDVAVRLQRFNPHIAPAWNVENLGVLIAVRSKAGAENR